MAALEADHYRSTASQQPASQEAGSTLKVPAARANSRGPRRKASAFEETQQDNGPQSDDQRPLQC